jgi:hypothetical protein
MMVAYHPRAAGITESDGSVSLKKLFTYDIVAGSWVCKNEHKSFK